VLAMHVASLNSGKQGGTAHQTKRRKLTHTRAWCARAKGRRIMRCSWLVGKSIRPGMSSSRGCAWPRTPTTTTTYATTTANLAAPAKRGKHGRSSKHYSRRESPASSHCCTQLAAAMRQKFVQFALALHLLQH